MAPLVNNLFAMQETYVRSLGRGDLLEKGMATHSSILAWRMPWTKEPGWLQSVRFQRVRHDCATFTFFFFLMLGKIEGGRRRERQRMRLDRHEFE